MRLMIASDIHGSFYYANKLVEAYKRENCKKLVLLGDILYHGPRNDLPRDYSPKAIIELLNGISEEILCVRGNCEAEVDQMVLSFNVLADYAIFYIGERMIFATHGHIYNENNLPSLKQGDVLLHGHTHIPVAKEIENGKYIYLNPGSVSIPKENSKNSYMLIEEYEDCGKVRMCAKCKSLDGEIIWNYTL